MMELVAMPFGLCNNLATLMNVISGDLSHKFVTLYLDDSYIDH
jgi:hypothetical protein